MFRIIEGADRGVQITEPPLNFHVFRKYIILFFIFAKLLQTSITTSIRYFIVIFEISRIRSAFGFCLGIYEYKINDKWGTDYESNDSAQLARFCNWIKDLFHPV